MSASDDNETTRSLSDGPSEDEEEEPTYSIYEIKMALKAWEDHSRIQREEFIVQYMQSQRLPRRCTNCRASIPWNRSFCNEYCMWENARLNEGGDEPE